MSSAPKIIDLYSGVGGLSLSAAKAGFKVAAAVEKEKRILDCHEKNFPDSAHICGDVSALSANDLSIQAKIGTGDELAGLVGGPPCQGFSTIGKRNVDDVRNGLFAHFFKLAAALRPAFFLAENVPGILHKQYGELRKNALSHAEGLYDILEPIEVVASDFGAATMRKRIFFIGVRKDLSGAELLSTAINAKKTEVSANVKDALEGLPDFISDDWLDFESSWRTVHNSTDKSYISDLNREVRGVGHEKSLKRFTNAREASGCFGTRHSSEVKERYEALMPGQQDSISKAKRLDANGLCPTLRAGTDNTKGSFQAVRPVHPTIARVITPREAARLQGFPDWFQFHETKWHSFRMIGNSVCPMAASKVLEAIRETLSM